MSNIVNIDEYRETLEKYLKKHSFCCECANMVNRWIRSFYSKDSLIQSLRLFLECIHIVLNPVLWILISFIRIRIRLRIWTKIEKKNNLFFLHIHFYQKYNAPKNNLLWYLWAYYLGALNKFVYFLKLTIFLWFCFFFVCELSMILAPDPQHCLNLYKYLFICFCSINLRAL